MAAGWGPVPSTDMPPLSGTMDPAGLLLSGVPKVKEAGLLAAMVDANARYYTQLWVYAVQLILVLTIVSSEMTKQKEVHCLKTKRRETPSYIKRKKRKVVKDFTDKGGRMYHEENGVKLIVPQGSVPHNDTYSITYNTVPYSDYDVPTGHHVVSPVPEFTAPGTFSKHVEVHLPLTSRASVEQDINVFYRNNTGDQWTQVRQEDTDSDVYFEIRDDEVVVHTTHFTQFMCTCKGAKNRELHLSAALFAYYPEEEKDRQEVQLTLYVVDKEFMPADFLKTLDAKEKGIMRRFEIHLPPLEGDRKYTPDDFLDVELYVEGEWNILNIDQRSDEKLESKKLQQLVSCHGQWGKKQMAKYFIQRPVTEDRKKNIMVQMMLKIRRKTSKGKKEEAQETVAEYTERIDLEQLFENMKLKEIAKSKPKKSTTSESGLEPLNGEEAIPEPVHDTHPDRPAKIEKLDSWEDKAGDAEDYENVPARHDQPKGPTDEGDEVDSGKKKKEGVTKDRSTGHGLQQATPPKQYPADDSPEDEFDLSLDDIVKENQPRRKTKPKDSPKAEDVGFLVDVTNTAPLVSAPVEPGPVKTGALIDLMDTSPVNPTPQHNQDGLLVKIDTQSAPTSPGYKDNVQTGSLIDLMEPSSMSDVPVSKPEALLAEIDTQGVESKKGDFGNLKNQFEKMSTKESHLVSITTEPKDDSPLVDINMENNEHREEIPHVPSVDSTPLMEPLVQDREQEEDKPTDIDMLSLRSQFENLSRDFSQKEETKLPKSAERKENQISVPVDKNAAYGVNDRQREGNHQIHQEDNPALLDTRTQDREQEEDKAPEVDMLSLRSQFENFQKEDTKLPKQAAQKEHKISAPVDKKLTDVEQKLDDTIKAAELKDEQRDEEHDDPDPAAMRVREFKSLRYRFESKTPSTEHPVYRSHGHFAKISGAPKRTPMEKPTDVPGKTTDDRVGQDHMTGSVVPWGQPRKQEQKERKRDKGRWRADPAPVRDSVRAGEPNMTASLQTDKAETTEERKKMDDMIKKIKDYVIKHNIKTDLGDLRYCGNIKELIAFYERIILGQGRKQLIWQKNEDGSASYIEVPVLETKTSTQARLAQGAPTELPQMQDDAQRRGNGGPNQLPEQRRRRGPGDLKRLQSEIGEDGVIIKLDELIDHYEQN